MMITKRVKIIAVVSLVVAVLIPVSGMMITEDLTNENTHENVKENLRQQLKDIPQQYNETKIELQKLLAEIGMNWSTEFQISEKTRLLSELNELYIQEKTLRAILNEELLVYPEMDMEEMIEYTFSDIQKDNGKTKEP